MSSQHQDLKALQRLLNEFDLLIEATPLPQEQAERFKDVLRPARALAEHLLEQTPAATLGKLSGQETAKRGPGYFKQIAGMRGTKAGGRPKKSR